MASAIEADEVMRWILHFPFEGEPHHGRCRVRGNRVLRENCQRRKQNCRNQEKRWLDHGQEFYDKRNDRVSPQALAPMRVSVAEVCRWQMAIASASATSAGSAITHRQRHLGNLTVTPGQHLGDLAFGESDATLTRPRLPPLPLGFNDQAHVTGVITVRATFHIEDR